MTGRRRRGRSGTGPDPLYLSWGAVAERAREITTALGGEPVSYFPKSAAWRPHTSLRWAISAVRTVAVLLDRRPGSVIVTNPPVFPGAIALIYGRLTGAPVVLDDHPGSFGAQGDLVAAKLLFAHRRMVPRAAACLVTADEWVRTVEDWGGNGIVLHEAPGDWVLRPPQQSQTLHRVLYVCTFGRDEPVEEVLDAAREVPGVQVTITGDRRYFPPELRSKVPDNVTLVGLLPTDRYREAVYQSDAIMALTTEPTSAMRAAFEGVWAGRPLILSDWPLLASLFPHAVRVPNDPAGIAAGIRRLRGEYSLRAAEVSGARDRQSQRWEQQLADLRVALGLTATRESTDPPADGPYHPGRMAVDEAV